MPDRYQQLVNSPMGGALADQLGLPQPATLRRHEPGAPLVPGPVLLAGHGRLVGPARQVCDAADATVHDEPSADGARYGAVVVDASSVADPAGLRLVYDAIQPLVRRIAPSGRVVVLAGVPDAGLPDAASGPAQHAGWQAASAQRALDGFIRSLGKELRGGATANLVRVAPGAEPALGSTLRFVLSGRSAYVDGQVVRIDPPVEGEAVTAADPDRPLTGRVAAITGAARGIGAAIADVMARQGAHVVGIDLPDAGDRLAVVANRVGGEALQLDITADDAPAHLTRFLAERHGGVDVVVHNAGTTRDKTLAGMDAERWDTIIDLNLASQHRLNAALLDQDTVRAGGRIVALSSLAGIAGNRGQTNYATSKAGVIGLAEALAPHLAQRRATINAVAPGFIETRLTDAMPLGVREVGRRLNSLNQGGLPIDVAETVAWLAEPGTGGVNGQVVRVCGQSLAGA